MIAYYDENQEREFAAEEPRAHPWSVTQYGKPEAYIDLKAEPHRVWEAACDFTEWRAFPESEAFAEFLGWLNRPRGSFESNDCAFRGPAPNTHDESCPAWMREKRLCANGRLMILFRHIPDNLAPHVIDWLVRGLQNSLQEIDHKGHYVAVGICRAPCRLLALPGEPVGSQVSIGWWGWGDDEAEAMAACGRAFEAIRQALTWAEEAIADAAKQQADAAGAGQTTTVAG